MYLYRERGREREIALLVCIYTERGEGKGNCVTSMYLYRERGREREIALLVCIYTERGEGKGNCVTSMYLYRERRMGREGEGREGGNGRSLYQKP